MESDIVERLRSATVPRLEMGWPAPHVVQRKEPLWLEAADEIVKLRAKVAAAIKQRDEARRMFCHEIAESGKLEHEYDENARLVAESFDWDCFAKEEE